MRGAPAARSWSGSARRNEQSSGMSYFEPSRRPFERHRLASPSSTLGWIFDQPPWQRILMLVGLAGYIGGAASLCGVAPAIAAISGAVTSLLLALLLFVYRLSVPVLSGVCFGLTIGLGILALALPAIVFLVMAFWLLVSLPLWLFRT
jgi:hypothetical protein